MTDCFCFTRRKFLKSGTLLLAATGMGWTEEGSRALDPSTLTPFVDPLPVPRLAKPIGIRANPERPDEKIPYYRMTMREVHQKVHRDLPATRMWSFEDSFPGPTLATESGHALMVEWVNMLPERHFLPIDPSLHGADPSLPAVRSVIHLHGGRTPAESDGYPESWVVPGKSQTCLYPARQDAALLFYHDHTMGINRLNTYAGMQGLFIVRDSIEAGLELPDGNYEIPLLVCDRLLRRDGQLDYPVSEHPGRPWVPEVFGNAILVNGKLLPYLEVEPRKYRLRLMNGSNGRFYRFSLANKRRFHVIGDDQGLLSAPVETPDRRGVAGQRSGRGTSNPVGAGRADRHRGRFWRHGRLQREAGERFVRCSRVPGTGNGHSRYARLAGDPAATAAARPSHGGAHATTYAR